MTETTVLDFKLSTTFGSYRAHMHAPEQQSHVQNNGVKIFYIGVSHHDPTEPP